MAEGQHNLAVQQQGVVLPFRVIEREEAGQHSSWTDEDLMLAHGQGDEVAFETLVKRHHRPIHNYMFRMVQNRQVAEDLAQEVFIALVKNGERYRPTAKFTTYMYTIASNIVSKEWARQKRRPKLLSLSRWWAGEDEADDYNPIEQAPDSAPNSLGLLEHSEVSDAVNAALTLLPEHQREAFVLRRFLDMSYEDIALVMEVPVGTVKSRVVRAERGLRPHLERFREYL
jgi:RNA polymerase sigma-70 factor (ECF subfamily)